MMTQTHPEDEAEEAVETPPAESNEAAEQAEGSENIDETEAEETVECFATAEDTAFDEVLPSPEPDELSHTAVQEDAK